MVEKIKTYTVEKGRSHSIDFNAQIPDSSPDPFDPEKLDGIIFFLEEGSSASVRDGDFSMTAQEKDGQLRVTTRSPNFGRNKMREHTFVTPGIVGGNIFTLTNGAQKRVEYEFRRA